MDPEVDRGQTPSLVDEQVALVHVGMEQAIPHGVAQEGLDDRSTEQG